MSYLDKLKRAEAGKPSPGSLYPQTPVTVVTEEATNDPILTPEGRKAVKAIDTVEEAPTQERAPNCWNCTATMTETLDIYGRDWWVCWLCVGSIQ